MLWRCYLLTTLSSADPLPDTGSSPCQSVRSSRTTTTSLPTSSLLHENRAAAITAHNYTAKHFFCLAHAYVCTYLTTRNKTITHSSLWTKHAQNLPCNINKRTCTYIHTYVCMYVYLHRHEYTNIFTVRTCKNCTNIQYTHAHIRYTRTHTLHHCWHLHWVAGYCQYSLALPTLGEVWLHHTIQWVQDKELVTFQIEKRQTA